MRKILSMLLAGALFVTACGDDDAGEESASTTSVAASDDSTVDATTDGSDDAAAAFPVTIEHMLGSVTIDAKPERVVTLGFTDTDIANSLGADIVAAVASPYGDDGANSLWAATTLPPEVTTLDVAAINLEAVAAADPDVILATATFPQTLELYDQLSEIAPVVAPITGPLLDSYEDLTTMIGTALGEADAAEALLAEVDTAAAAFAEAHPELDGRTVAFAPGDADRRAVFVDPEAASITFLGTLGMSLPQEILDLEGQRTFGAVFVGPELIGVLDSADVAIVGLYTPDAEETFLELPGIVGSDLLANDAIIPIDQTMTAALQSPNPASLLYVLENLAPIIAEKVQ